MSDSLVIIISLTLAALIVYIWSRFNKTKGKDKPTIVVNGVILKDNLQKETNRIFFLNIHLNMADSQDPIINHYVGIDNKSFHHISNYEDKEFTVSEIKGFLNNKEFDCIFKISSSYTNPTDIIIEKIYIKDNLVDSSLMWYVNT